MQRLLKSAYCFFAALLLTTAAAAQHKISGRVIDTTQEPLVGATITLKEKPSVGTTTDTEGRYTLTLPDQKEYTVQVSFVGYVTATKKTTAARQGRLDFILKEDQMNLSTVVITGTRTPKLLKDAPIILLDEATASLDVENETAIQEALSRLIKDKTVLIIAHRMRTVAGADQVVVLSGGIVAEQGSPVELYARKGLYTHMVDLQSASQNWTT